MTKRIRSVFDAAAHDNPDCGRRPRWLLIILKNAGWPPSFFADSE
jgi:hypothetical protein